jgi:hypothetical protein
VNHGEAEILLMRMSQSWRAPFDGEWYEFFADLDAGKAGTAFVRLRDSEERPPTIAKFRQAYSALRGDTSSHEPKCPACDGTGMRAPDFDAWGSESIPCELCEMGKIQAERVKAPRAEAPGRLSERTCDIGIANVYQCLEQLKQHRPTANVRRAS